MKPAADPTATIEVPRELALRCPRGSRLVEWVWFWGGARHTCNRFRAADKPRPSRGQSADIANIHERTARSARGAGQGTPPVVLAVGHVPDRRRLLLHARLPALDRIRERGPARSVRDDRPGSGHALRRVAGLLVRVRPIPYRARFDRYARAAGFGMGRQNPRARPAGLRGHRFRHHQDPLGRRTPRST